MWAAACAGSSAERPADLDRTFAQIQVHEAGIEHSQAVAENSDTTCAEQCAAATDAARHERDLCALARSAADADALERCDRAMRTSSAIDTGTRARCRCQVQSQEPAGGE
jgi:hypothetical protein